MSQQPRIALATCAAHPGLIAGDDEALIERLAAMGFACARPRWDDASVGWSSYDAVLIRSTWDYQEHLGAFLRWAGQVEAVTRLFNPAGVVRANVDKRYLRRLERGGVPIVPTAWIEGETDASGLLGVLDAIGAGETGAIKPVVGAGASGLLLFGRGEAARAAAHANEQIAVCGGVLVQPAVESVRTRGELSVVLIDGEVTHAVRKVPSSDEWRVQVEFGGTYTLEAAGPAELDIARRAVAVLGGGETPLYARIDLVEVDGIGPSVIEAELIEPELFFPLAPEAGDRLGRALARRLGAALPSGS